MPKYSIKNDEAFVIESLEQIRAIKYRQYSRILVKLVCLLGLGLLFTVCIYVKVYPIAALFAVFIALLLVGPRFDYWLMEKRLRKSPFYNKQLQLLVTDKGVNIQSSISNVELSWEAFTGFIRNKNGFLVFSGKSEKLWWPDSALAEGEVSEVELLVNQYIGT